MKHPRSGYPSFCQLVEPGPVHPGPLPATAQCPSPESGYPLPEDPQSNEVSRYRVVVEVALHDRPEPLAGLRHRIMHPSSELLLDLLQLRSHTFADRLSLHLECPVPGLPAYVREAQKVERPGLAFSSPFPVRVGKPPELDPARLVGMEFQSEFPQPFPQVLQKTVGLDLVLES